MSHLDQEIMIILDCLGYAQSLYDVSFTNIILSISY